MVKVEIKGLDFKRDLQDAQRALTSLDGEVASLRFNPNDRNDVQRAIREMEGAVDAKVFAYCNNSIVEQVVTGAKRKFRDAILQRAQEAH